MKLLKIVLLRQYNRLLFIVQNLVFELRFYIISFGHWSVSVSVHGNSTCCFRDCLKMIGGGGGKTAVFLLKNQDHLSSIVNI